MKMTKKGQAGLVLGVVTAIVGLILLIGVLVPITTNVTGNQGFTGVNKTIADNLVTFILIGALLMIVGFVYFKMKE